MASTSTHDPAEASTVAVPGPESSSAASFEDECSNSDLLRVALTGDVLELSRVYDKIPDPDIEWRERPELWPMDSQSISLIFDSTGKRASDLPAAGPRAVDVACLEGHARIVQFLLDRGALVRGGDMGATTLLHFAAARDHVDVVEVILNHDASLDFINARSWWCYPDPKLTFRNRLYFDNPPANGMTALDAAASIRSWGVVRLLIERGASAGYCLYWAIDSSLPGMLYMVVRLLEHGYTGERHDRAGSTAIHLLLLKQARTVNTNMDDVSRAVEMMLDQGIDQTQESPEGRTAWDLAHEVGMVDVLGLLAERGVARRTQVGRHEFQSVWQGRRGGGEWIYLQSNTLAEVLGHARRLANERDIPTTMLMEHIWVSFVHEQSDSTWRICRETGFSFQDIHCPLRQGSRMISNFLQFSSINIPFIWVVRPSYIEQRKNRASTPVLRWMRHCAASDTSQLLHCEPQTLDEYTNLGLDEQVLEERNSDQALLRYSSRKQDPYIIVVLQAWIWKVGSDIISSIPREAKQVATIMRKRYHWPGRTAASADQIVGWLLADILDSLDRPHTGGYDEPILDVFAKEISLLSNRVNAYVDETKVSTASMDKEKEFFHEISDIRDELSMLENVISKQEEIWKEFALRAWPQPENWPEGPNGRFIPRNTSPIPIPTDENTDEDDDSNSTETFSHKETISRQNFIQMVNRNIDKPQYHLPRHKRRIAKLDADARRIELSIQIRLDLKQKHLTLQETHSMTVMSASVFAFTVITIIFTPLSFAVSLFALPVDQFAAQQTPIDDEKQDEKVYTSGYIAKWLGGSPFHTSLLFVSSWNIGLNYQLTSLTDQVTIEIVALVVTLLASLVAFKYFLEMELRHELLRPLKRWFAPVKSPNSAGTNNMMQENIDSVDYMREKPDIDPLDGGVGKDPAIKLYDKAALSDTNSRFHGLVRRVRGARTDPRDDPHAIV